MKKIFLKKTNGSSTAAAACVALQKSEIRNPKWIGAFVGFLLFFCGQVGRPDGFQTAGTAGADFLKIIPSTRASGMGGALVAFSDDLSSLDLNPAGLAMLSGPVATASHLSYFQSINMEYLALGSPFSW